MRTLKTLSQTFVKSISSFTYYREVLKASFALSFKYFIGFSLFFALVTSAFVGFNSIPSLLRVSDRFSQRAANFFPPDLVIDIKSGQITTNVTEPLRFPLPYELFADTPPAISDQQQTYLVTIDTQAVVDDYEKSQSLMLVTKDTIVFPRDNGGYQVMPLSQMQNFTLDKNRYDKFVSAAIPFLRVLPVLIVFAVFGAVFLGFGIVRLFSLVLLSVLLLVVAKLMHLPITYRKMLQISLHSSTLPFILQITLNSFGIVPPIPFFNSILFLLFTLIILAELKKPQEQKISPKQS